MKKSIFVITMALTFGLALINTGCGGEKTADKDSTKTNSATVEAPKDTTSAVDTSAHVDTTAH